MKNCRLLARRLALSLNGDDEKVEAGDDLFGVDQVVDATPVALGRVSERVSKLTQGAIHHNFQLILYEGLHP